MRLRVQSTPSEDGILVLLDALDTVLGSALTPSFKLPDLLAEGVLFKNVVVPIHRLDIPYVHLLGNRRP